VLGYVGGSAAGIAGASSAWNARPPSRPEREPIASLQALGLETDLRVSIRETEHAAEPLWIELRGMALDSTMADERLVEYARRYVNALQAAAGIVDHHVARNLAIARSCAECPEFATESRALCGALASHLDSLVAMWQERSWLLERSKRNTLDFLVLADHP
jgi:hypothetical protein